VEGILIVASGGDNQKVKQNISEAVLALFQVEAHRIKIVKMSGLEDSK
jgi:stage III sporulation protein AG